MFDESLAILWVESRGVGLDMAWTYTSIRKSKNKLV